MDTATMRTAMAPPPQQQQQGLVVQMRELLQQHQQLRRSSKKRRAVAELSCCLFGAVLCWTCLVCGFCCCGCLCCAPMRSGNTCECATRPLPRALDACKQLDTPAHVAAATVADDSIKVRRYTAAAVSGPSVHPAPCPSYTTHHSQDNPLPPPRARPCCSLTRSYEHGHAAPHFLVQQHHSSSDSMTISPPSIRSRKAESSTGTAAGR